jgi:EAL domain-containing protein (putative c-di-GMP-specific phosphodiesterase class I)
MPASVNLCTSNLESEHLFDIIQEALEASGVSGGMLVLEVTEREVLHKPQFAADLLQKIRKLGVRTSIDDFLTGQNGVARLKELGFVDELKLDVSIVRDIENPTNQSFVEHLVRFAHDNGMIVIAEGAETQSAFAHLHPLGVDAIQGFVISRAMPGDKLLPWLIDSPWKAPNVLASEISHKGDPQKRTASR